jgi:tetratricopeptide (TPR) repeat protein
MKWHRRRRWCGALALLCWLVGAHAEDKLIELPLSGPAYRFAAQAYISYERGQYRAAEAQAREALRLRPDVLRLRALLANIVAAQRHAQPATVKLKTNKIKAGPKPDAAFGAADQAYKAYDNGDFDAAITKAGSAVALAPGNSAYRLLLVNALMAGQRFEQAAAAIDAALAAGADPDGALAARRAPIRARLAEQPAAATYRALEQGDLAAAAVAARKAVALAPDLSAYRLLLLQVLARAQLWDEAQQAIADALAQDDNDSALLAMRGYLHQRGGRGAAAQADFERALKQPGLNASAARNIALIAADAALAAGMAQRAIDLLAPLTDASLTQGRLHAARAALARSDAALARPDAETIGAQADLAVPELDCRTTPYGQVCTLLPGGAPRDAGFDAANDAYAAIAGRRYELAAQRARAAVAASPGRRSYQLVLLSALQAGRQRLEAEALATTLLEADGADAQLLMRRGMLRKELGKKDAAREDFSAAAQLHTLAPADEIALLGQLDRRREASARLAEALEKGQMAGMPELEIAYLASSIGDDARALALFQHADAQALLPASALQDAAYAAIHASSNDAAIAYFMRSGDAQRDGKLELDEAQRFAVRRAVAELSRSWGVFAALGYRGASALRAIVPNAADVSNDGVQAGAEAYWRPFGSSNGRQFELFARAYETLRSGAGQRTGGATLQGSLGARIKPFGEHNLFLSLSRLVPLGAAASTDWLVQASYFHGRGGDLRTDAASWWTGQIAVDAGRYVEQAQHYGALSAQFGRSYRPAASHPTLVLFPHLVLALDHNSALARRNAAGIGAGATLRYWFREDVHAAPRSYVDFTLQYRARLGGDARGKGVFLTAALSY